MWCSLESNNSQNSFHPRALASQFIWQKFNDKIENLTYVPREIQFFLPLPRFHLQLPPWNFLLLHKCSSLLCYISGFSFIITLLWITISYYMTYLSLFITDRIIQKLYLTRTILGAQLSTLYNLVQGASSTWLLCVTLSLHQSFVSFHSIRFYCFL